jgi:hypothetical protein
MRQTASATGSIMTLETTDQLIKGEEWLESDTTLYYSPGQCVDGVLGGT